MLLMAGMSVYGTPSAWANPEPQQQGQAVTTITGTVLDENNEPVIGASVVQKGTRNAVATDAFGNFKIRVPEGTVLEVSYVGYKAVGIAAKQGMTVYLQPTTEMLNELVAIGYGSQKRANLTGAVATVDVARTMDSRSNRRYRQVAAGCCPRSYHHHGRRRYQYSVEHQDSRPRHTFQQPGFQSSYNCRRCRG